MMLMVWSREVADSRVAIEARREAQMRGLPGIMDLTHVGELGLNWEDEQEMKGENLQQTRLTDK
jgi:hypothetical protein